MNKYKILFLLPSALVSVLASCQVEAPKPKVNIDLMKFPVQKTEQEWQKELSPEEYYVLRQKGTERPHTGEYNMHFEKGMYNCRACGFQLFSSDSKFKSHCGWPSFDQGIKDGHIVEVVDRSHGMVRTEILCANCGGHLGHVFDDGPTQTGLRYCVNSLSVTFEEETESKEE